MNKSTALEILSICEVRKTADLPCKDCKNKGESCIEAHTYAVSAIKLTKEREVNK